MITNKEKEMLLEQMENILDKYNYHWDENALCRIVDTWAKNKAELIEKFKSHPNYLEGKFMITFDVDYDREINKEQSRVFRRWMSSVYDTVKENFPAEFIDKVAQKNAEIRKNVGVPDDEYWYPYKYTGVLDGFINNLEDYASRTIDENIARAIDVEIPNAHIHPNEKMSRAVNKICTYLGFTKHPDYNKEFAKYADSLSPLKIKRHTILSINPLDYLLMSNGNSWSSCHSIINKGCYSSGTISYMLDGSSMVFYTVDSSYNGNEYYYEPKINRQMFHYGEEKLVQGRLYPQSCDCGSKDVYDAYRAIVQKIMSELYNFPNRWKVSRGTAAACQYVDSEGTHYQDYENFDTCTLSRVRDSENNYDFTIGNDPICISCGGYHDVEDNIDCCIGDGYYCANCGDWVSEYDVRWSNDTAYCEDCVTYCEICGDYELNENVQYIDGVGDVCDYCLERCFTRCDECGEYVRNENSEYIESEDAYVCSYCYENNFTECYACGDNVRNSDITEVDGEYYCPDCYEKYIVKCENCGNPIHKVDAIEHDGVWYCPDCYEENEEEAV